MDKFSFFFCKNFTKKWRKMQSKKDIIELLTSYWVYIVALVASLITYLKAVEKKEKVFTLLGFLIAGIEGCFIGIMTYIFCKHIGLDDLVTAGLIGTFASMGHEGLEKIKKGFSKSLDDKKR